jgi:hypothetical protein
MAGVLAITLGGLAQAMETKAVSLSSGGAPGSFAVVPDSQAIALFSLESPLATSSEARAFIQARLEEWEQEKASVLTLACQIGGHYGAQFQMLRSDLRFEERSAARSHSQDDDLISNRDEYTPARIALPASALPAREELQAEASGEDLPAPEASGPVAEAKVEIEAATEPKASVASAHVPRSGGAAPTSPAPGTPPGRTFDEYYRFADCSRQPRRVTGTLPVSKGVARIREEVEMRSMDLTSGKLVRLVKALEPYGAKCEPTRKNGIMVKLPTGRTDMPFIAKLFHRTHAAHDSFDCNSVEAAKELFDGSIFSVDKFR